MDEQLEVALKGGEFKRLLESFFSDIKKKYDLKKVDIEVLFFLSQCSDDDTPTDIKVKINIDLMGYIYPKRKSIEVKDKIQFEINPDDSQEIQNYLFKK